MNENIFFNETLQKEIAALAQRITDEKKTRTSRQRNHALDMIQRASIWLDQDTLAINEAESNKA